jgi:hypothetical protein
MSPETMSPQTMTPDGVIAAGGIALAAVEADASDRLDALAFTHPALPGRTVVRLVPERVASGTRTEMALTGFVDAGGTAGVGRVRRRALGFPARALVEHPADARYVLAVMKEFVAAKKRIATKPGHARDAFVEMAETLGRGAPHFLPSFWEEAGRAFLAGGAQAMAATAFEKARAAERQHGLRVDEDARADAFLEFAIAGALPVKSILAWPAELKKTHGAEVAYTRLYDLATRRTLGGRAPWASLPKDLRDLAKAAKRDPAAEEGRFVRAVLGAAALRRAPIGFWKAVGESVAVIAREPGVPERLARLFPEVSGDDAEVWIGLLTKWGVVGQLAGGLLGSGLAAWVGKALEAWDDADGVHGLVTTLVPRLLADGTPVPVFGDGVWRVEAVDTFEALVAAGVPLAVDEDPGTFALASWAAKDGERVDPVHLAAHPVLGKVLVDSVRGALDDSDFQRVAPGLTAFREPRRAHLAETVEKAQRGGLLDLGASLDTLEGEVPASTRAEFPDEAAPIASLHAATALARTLAGGVLDELGWQALDDVVAELRGTKNAEVEVTALAPWCVVSDERRACVLGPAGVEGGVEGRFDLKLPKGARLAGFRVSAGQLLVAWRTPDDWSKRRGYWSGSPRTVVDLDWGYGDPERTPPHGDGVLCGGRLLRPGDTHVARGEAFCDAEGAWTADDDGVLRTLDPATGKRGAPDAPAALAPRDGVVPSYSDSVYHPRVTTGSPLGGADPHGFVVFDLGEVEDSEAWITKHAPRAVRVPGGEGDTHVGLGTDGRAVVFAGTPKALVTWPGADAPRLVAEAGWRDAELWAPDGTRLATLEEGTWWAGSPSPVPLALWHHLRPRDPAGSAALRRVDEAAARALLAAAEGLEDDEDGTAALVAKVRGLLPITHDALAKGVASVVLEARRLQERLDTWRADAAGAAVEGTRDETFRAALTGLVPGYGDDDTSVVVSIRTASAFLGGADGKPHVSDLPWRDWLDTWGALAFRARAPLTTPEERAAIGEILDALAGSNFAAPGVRRVKLTVPPSTGWLAWHTEYGDKSVPDDWTRVDGARRMVVHTDEQDDDSVVLDVLLVGDDPPGATVDNPRPVLLDAAAIRAQLAAPSLTAVGDDVYAAIAGPTGLGRADAAVIWSGLHKLDRWGNDPLGKDGRERLGLKLPETKIARDSISSLDTGKVSRALHAALGDPADTDGLPARIGAAWVATFGARVKLDDALLARARADLPGGDVDALVELAGVATADVYQRDARWKLTGDGPAAEADGDHFDGDVLQRGVGVVYWLYANTPGDDPLRDTAAAAVTAMRARLDALVLAVARGGEKPLVGWFKRFDGAPFVPADIDADLDTADRPTGKDGGGIVAVGNKEDVSVAVRPNRLRPGDAEELERLVKLDDNWEDVGPWRALALLGSPNLDAMLAARAPGWGQDPRLSAPAVVQAVAKKHGLEEDAATLYAQLLALHNPTKANVLAWNGWKPATYTKAAAALVEAKLVIEAKRARAGRDHFLPGGWHERRSGSLPLEEWKLPLYGGEEPPLGSILPLMAFGALFEGAWGRVLGGKGPRYERT